MFSGAGFQDILARLVYFLLTAMTESRAEIHSSYGGSRGDTVAIDVRMLRFSGIGRYLQNTVPIVVGSLKGVPITLLGDPSDTSSFPQSASARFCPFEPRIYSISEQIRFLPHRNSFSLFWSPHYNVPIAHRGKLLV